MRTLLIQPPRPAISIGQEHLFLDEPLALEYIGADIRPFSEVKILDMRLEKSLIQTLHSFQPNVVGITGYTVHVPSIRSICDQVKENLPHTITIVGGHHATVSPDDFRHPSIDVVVIGDGVPTLREIIQKLEAKQNLNDIPGIAINGNGKLMKNPSRPWTSLDDFPLPDRSLTKQYRTRYYSEWWRPAASTRTSRGCPHRCNFCAQWKVNGGKYFTRSINSIVEELSRINESYVYLADDETFVDARRMIGLAEAIESAGIKKNYMGYIRSDTVVKHPKMIEKWKRIGLDALVMGVEFYSQRDLDYVNKGLSAEENRQAIEILRSLDIRLSPALFIVRPDYDVTDFIEYSQYIKSLDIELAEFTVLTPLPGTQLYDEVRNDLLEVDFEFYDLLHTVLPTKLTLKEFYANLAKLYASSHPIKKQLRYLLRFPFYRIPQVAWGNYRLLRRVGNLYKDYATA